MDCPDWVWPIRRECRNRRSRDLTLVPKFTSYKVSTSEGVDVEVLSSTALYALPICDFDLRPSHARTLMPAALASVLLWFVLV